MQAGLNAMRAKIVPTNVFPASLTASRWKKEIDLSNKFFGLIEEPMDVVTFEKSGYHLWSW
jgi:hypothetical protein